MVLSANSFAQKIVTGKITYTYIIPSDESVKEAEISALKQAQYQMIADHFGTVVGASTSLYISDSSVQSTTYGETDVKGEWIETLGAPQYRKIVADDEFMIEVTVSGRIREIISNPTEFLCKVLKTPTDEYENFSFKNGEYMYMSFQSPTDGYLTVYITDGESVQCLYPYIGLSSDYMRVKADEKHILFSRRHPGELDPLKVKQVPLSCGLKDVEHDRIYVIFSPNRFTKAIDSAEDNKAYRMLDYESFHSWLSKIRRYDKEMNVKPIDITISK